MLDRLESNYDCSNAGEDLPKLLKELEDMKSNAGDGASQETVDVINRLENQIHFIRNKCGIPHRH